MDDWHREMLYLARSVNEMLVKMSSPPVMVAGTNIGDLDLRPGAAFPPPSADMAVNAIKQNDELRKDNDYLRGLVESAYREGTRSAIYDFPWEQSDAFHKLNALDKSRS